MLEIKKMEVELIELCGIEGIRKAVVQPYDSKPKDVDKLAVSVWNKGHRSITRHSIITFQVKNLSQSLLRQLSRHPHENLTVKSSRYCNMSGVGFYIPPKLDEMPNGGSREEWIKDMTTIMDIYRKWKWYEGDEKLDISKLCLPLGSHTDLIVSGNIQAMYEMLELRMCVRTESEYHKMAVLMRNILANHDEYIVSKIFSKLGCKGDALGYCPEGSLGCGKFNKKEE